MNDVVALQNAVTIGQNRRKKILKQRQAGESAQQQFSAKVVGFEDGFVLVSVNQGGAQRGRSLSNGNFAVGEIASFFLPRGESVGFVDKHPSG
ncbi:MAG: hypothetical protein ACRCZS_16915 [Chroococcidiopsis sp.]